MFHTDTPPRLFGLMTPKQLFPREHLQTRDLLLQQDPYGVSEQGLSWAVTALPLPFAFDEPRPLLRASESPLAFTISFTLDSESALADAVWSEPLTAPMASAMARATGSAMAVARFLWMDCAKPPWVQAEEAAVAVAW